MIQKYRRNILKAMEMRKLYLRNSSFQFDLQNVENV